jgi:hypothetical protein
MIKNTFQHLERVSNNKEISLWGQGITDWQSFLETEKIKGISNRKKPYFDRQIIKARSALYNQESSFFVDKLVSTETWRLYGFFKDEAVFLDIEAEGTGKNADVTVIGLYDGLNTKTMIKGVNMDYNVLRNELKKYKIIITFNGSSFDIPFIKKRYDILPNVPHIDLRHCCARLGFKGGLKQIEKEFDIKRSKIIDNFYGGDPLTLWKMYRASGDRYYLDLLIEYNEQDTISLKKIMDFCYKHLSRELRSRICS